MTRYILSKSHSVPRPEPAPDVLPLPVDPDKFPTPEPASDDPDRGGEIPAVSTQQIRVQPIGANAFLMGA
jgi:hypothetical protein